MAGGEYKVYCHKTPSGKRYFGITSRKVSERWGHGKGYESCSAFKKAIEKYGWDNIEHFVLFDGLTKEEAENKERELIARYKTTDRKYGYNILPYGNISKCKEVPKSVREKATAERTKVGRSQTAESIEKALKTKTKLGIIKPIVCYETGVVYPSISEASKQMCLSGTNVILIALKSPAYTAAGYHWCYLESLNTFEPAPKKTYRPVINIETGKRYSSIAEAAEDTGADASGIVLTCEGKRRRTNGLSFCYEEEVDSFVPQEEYKRKKKVRNIDTGEVFESAAAAARAYGYSDAAISVVCKGKRKSIYGNRWEYVNQEDADLHTGIAGKKIDRDGKRSPVVNIDTGEKYESISAAARQTGLQRRCIGKCCVIHHYTAGGYHWRYADDWGH